MFGWKNISAAEIIDGFGSRPLRLPQHQVSLSSNHLLLCEEIGQKSTWSYEGAKRAADLVDQ
jgi:hypothetical protein